MHVQLIKRFVSLASIASMAAFAVACSSPSSPLSQTSPSAVSAAAGAGSVFGSNPSCEPPNVIDPVSGECVPPPPPPPPPPTGKEGCTPGYWKANAKLSGSEWAAAGYSPSQLVATVFSAGAPYNSATLLEALEYGGGAGVDGATRNLLRAAVAAVLNAANSGVAYPRSVASVVADVNAAIASGNRAEILALAAALDADNNLGCPLNNGN